MNANADALEPAIAAFQAAALAGASYPSTQEEGGGAGPSFVTISRQAGAGGRTLGRALTRLLNEADPGDRPWTCWDHELIDRFSSAHGMPPKVVERFAAPPVPWIQLFVHGLSRAEPGDPDEFLIYRRIALNLRGLARLARCVIVGRGGACATEDMPGGVHVRLVAPLEYRIAHLANFAPGSSPHDATSTLARLDRERAAFYRRYWPHKPLIPERFGITLNAAVAPVEALARCVLPLVRPRRAFEQDCPRVLSVVGGEDG
jgi:hypothetical protein